MLTSASFSCQACSRILWRCEVASRSMEAWSSSISHAIHEVQLLSSFSIFILQACSKTEYCFWRAGRQAMPLAALCRRKS